MLFVIPSLLHRAVFAILVAPPTPLPATGPGVPSQDAGDPVNTLLILVAVVLVIVGAVVIAIGVLSNRANERTEQEAQERLAEGEFAHEPPPADDLAGRKPGSSPGK